MPRSRKPSSDEPTSPYGRVVLVRGPEELLAERYVDEQLAACRAEAPDVEVTRAEAAELDVTGLGQLASGSLLATHSAVVIDHLADADSSLGSALLDLAASPAPELALILVHHGGVKGKGLLDKLTKAGVGVRRADALKPSEVTGFVVAEARRAGVRIDGPAAGSLVDAVGTDLRSLAQAVRQLAEDTDDPRIDTVTVQRYFQGRAEVKGFTIADAALAGETTRALTELRWALASGTPAVLVTGAMAAGVRSLGRLSGIRGRANDREVAAELGVPPWKLRTLRQQLSRWDAEGLARAVVLVARADAAVKGAAGDADHALETMVLRVSRLAR